MRHQHHKHVERMVDGAVEGAAAGIRLATRALVERTPTPADSSTGSSSTCEKGNDSPQCITPASRQNQQTLAIVLGVVIPLTGAILALIFLHRRLQRKQRAEDMNDPHDSVDFGMEGVQKTISKRPKKGPEMIVTDLGGATSGKKKGHGLSFDLGVNSPYLLPAGLQGSNESIHSMSRNLHDEHDPYRPVTMLRPSMDTDSLRFGGRMHDDKGSLYSMSTGQHSSSAALIANARPMSQTQIPSRTASRFGGESMSVSSPLATPASEFPPRSLHSSLNRNSPPSYVSNEKNLPEIVESVLPSPPAVPEPVALEMPPPRKPLPPRKDSMSIPVSAIRPESSNYGDDEPPAPANPNVVINEPYEVDPLEMYARYSLDGADAQPTPTLHAPQSQRMSTLGAPDRMSLAPGPEAYGSRLSVMGGGQRLSVLGAGNRLSVMGARPLPADLPDDNPEVRANRIRSFYKEYFDESKPVPANAHYENDGYYDDGVMDGAIYDPDSGGFFVPGAKPFAQPVGRRAMTPPPRSRPRISGNSTLPHQRKFSTYSTMSGGRPGMRGRPLVAQKKLPPPMPLLSLPTPHALKQDAWISNPIDFAPPSSVRTVQNGARPDSPFGVQRPYSPSVRAFTPLASSFDVLSVLPSPHDLRKSTTFTALDFAPPSRIRDPAAMGGGSDAGSIRSARSGISAMQHQAVREGAYRVSRIPKEMVTSREDLASQLRPKMDMISKA